MRKNHTSGLTLVELLVVVAIIALLLALLMPVLDNARDRAVTVQCMSQVRQLTIGQLSYAGDWDGALLSAYSTMIRNCPSPPLADPYPCAQTAFLTRMDPYTGNNRSLWLCPARPPTYNEPTYGLSPGVDGQTPLGGFGAWCGNCYVRLGAIPRPSTTAVYMDRLKYLPPDIDSTWYTAQTPVIVPNINIDYGPWPLHRKGPMRVMTVYGLPRYYTNQDTVMSRVDGSARPYLWTEVLGSGSLRNYLYFGTQPAAGLE